MQPSNALRQTSRRQTSARFFTRLPRSLRVLRAYVQIQRQSHRPRDNTNRWYEAINSDCLRLQFAVLMISIDVHDHAPPPPSSTPVWLARRISTAARELPHMPTDQLKRGLQWFTTYAHDCCLSVILERFFNSQAFAELHPSLANNNKVRDAGASTSAHDAP